MLYIVTNWIDIYIYILNILNIYLIMSKGYDLGTFIVVVIQEIEHEDENELRSSLSEE